MGGIIRRGGSSVGARVCIVGVCANDVGACVGA
jgi:hypothetical protein